MEIDTDFFVAQQSVTDLIEAMTYGSKNISDSLRSVASVETDSRLVQKGSLYIAIKGNRFDGHDFISDVDGKAALMIVSSENYLPQKSSYVLVKDTVKAMTELAVYLRKQFQGKVFAMTGSCGKSSTKDFLKTLIGHKVTAAPDSFNNRIGVAKTIFLLKKSDNFLVLEMGTNHHGEIEELCQNYEPHYVCITNIGDAHQGNFGGKQGVYSAKKEMFAAFFHYAALSPENKGYVYCLDEPSVMQAQEEVFGGLSTVRRLTYSTQDDKASVIVRGSMRKSDSVGWGLSMSVWRYGRECGSFIVPLYGIHQAQNIAASLAFIELSESSLFEKALQRIPKLKASDHRGQMYPLRKGGVLIDESFNSNPKALTSSLNTLASFECLDQKHILILGDMAEMGSFADESHRQVLDTVKDLFGSRRELFLMTVGPVFQKLIHSDSEFKDISQCFDDYASCQEVARTLIHGSELVLVKSSRLWQLDKVVETIHQYHS